MGKTSSMLTFPSASKKVIVLPLAISPYSFDSKRLPPISSTAVSTARRRKPIGSPIAYEKNCAM